MSKREGIEQYFIDYEKCWNDIKRFHEQIEMMTAKQQGLFKVTDLMKKIEDKYKFKMIVQ